MVDECNFQMLIKPHVHASTAAVTTQIPPSKVLRVKRKGGSHTYTDIISDFSQLHDWNLLSTPLTTLSLTTKQKALGTLQLPKISLSAGIGLMVHPFCCGRAVASQPLVASRSSGCTVKRVLRKKLLLFPNSSMKQQECPVLAPPKWQENHLRSQSYPIHRVAWRSI